MGFELLHLKFYGDHEKTRRGKTNLATKVRSHILVHYCGLQLEGHELGRDIFSNRNFHPNLI